MLDKSYTSTKGIYLQKLPLYWLFIDEPVTQCDVSVVENTFFRWLQNDRNGK